ncbi:MAG: mechanosensitive ion channel family protein [Bacteroidota bacterium]
MENFFSDLSIQLQAYYDGIIALLPKLVVAIITFTVLFFVANRSRTLVNNRLSKQMDDPLLARFLARLVKTTIVVLALMLVLKIIGLGDIAAGLVTGASVSAIVVGFAFKDIGENFLAGIMLAFSRPFRVGDTVELNGEKGKVVALNMRNTQIKSFDGKDIYIPNANIIKNPVVNYTIDGFLRNEFVIGLDYGSDVDKAIHIIKDELAKVPGVLQEEKLPSVFVGNLNTSTLDLTVQYWLDTFDSTHSGTTIKTTAVNNVLQALETEGFYLPGQVVELKNYNEKDLSTASNDKTSTAA